MGKQLLTELTRLIRSKQEITQATKLENKMEITVHANHGNTRSIFTEETHNRLDVILEKTEITEHQDGNTFGAGINVVKVKIVDPETGKWCWFDVEARISPGHEPQIRVEDVSSGAREFTTGNWRNPVK